MKGGARERRSSPWAWVALALAAAVLGARSWWLWGSSLVLDDAFISFRYARHAAAGLGLVFNPGELVEGYTNFLWTLLFVGPARLGLDLVATSKWLGLAAALGIVTLLWRAAEPLWDETWARALPALLFAATATVARFVVSGMETLLFTLLVVGGLLVAAGIGLAGDRPWVAGLILGLAALTRPEGSFYAGLAAAWMVGEGAVAGSVRPALRRAVGLVGAWAAVVGPHFVWRLVYYGHPLPNTFYVKVGGLGTARLAGGVEMLGRAASQWDVWVTLVVFGIGLGSLPRRPVWRLAVLAVLGTVASFVVVGGDFIAFFGPRFLMPAYPLVLLVTTEGVRRIAVGWRRPGVMLAAALALALLVEAAWLSWPRRFYRLHGIQQLNDSWRETADWILRETPPGATVALGSAGIIPYLTDRATIDMFGLTDAHIAHHGRPDPSAPPGHQKVDPAYVLDRQPAIIVSRIDEQGRPLTAGLAEFADRIRTEYELAGLVKTRGGRPLSRRWVVPGRRWTGTLHERGYDTGIFVRRGEWAQQVKSSPPPMTRRGAHR